MCMLRQSAHVIVIFQKHSMQIQQCGSRFMSVEISSVEGDLFCAQKGSHAQIWSHIITI